MIFISPTNGKMTKPEIYDFILKKIQENQITKEHDYSIIVGTDSQNSYKTKMVLVICLIDKGHGGRYFYHIDWMKKIKDIIVSKKEPMDSNAAWLLPSEDGTFKFKVYSSNG